MNKKIIKNIWAKAPTKFMQVEHSSQKNVLHPLISNIINNEKPSQFLDYGCGDGRILELLNSDIKIDVFDINNGMLDLAEKRLGSRVNNYYNKIDKIESKYYDFILLGMVIICLKNDKEFDDLLCNIKRFKTKNGKLLISAPHPCFRDKKFSNFQTSLGSTQEFYYLKNGMPFDVLIEDQKPPSVAFTDYHWSLSATINKLIEHNFTIKNIIEVKDDKNHPNCNNFYSPFVIITAI